MKGVSKTYETCLVAMLLLGILATVGFGESMVLSNGVPVTNISGMTGSEQFYTIEVPSGQDELQIDISGGSGDADLYVKFDMPPTTASFDYRPYLPGNNETVTVDNPTEGTWHIMIRGYSSYSGVTLQATYSVSPVAVCQDVVASAGPDGTADISIDGGSYDPDGDTVTLVQEPPGPYPVGMYSVVLTVTDPSWASDTCEATVVVYDPSAGFVTGAGWIDSPVNEAYQYMQVGGNATFGFIAKYKKGANVPDGQTQLIFSAGDLNFYSTSYDWLVVTGAPNAKLKGIGTINGDGDYKFQIWASDDPDTFRIRIWMEDGNDEIVVYDNGSNQTIGGGSILIHTK